jgi:hypothetical protein
MVAQIGFEVKTIPYLPIIEGILPENLYEPSFKTTVLVGWMRTFAGRRFMGKKLGNSFNGANFKTHDLGFLTRPELIAIIEFFPYTISIVF